MVAWYNRIVWGSLGLCAAVIFAVASFQEPLDGDLTRTGGYSERRFGAHTEQEYFQQEFLFRVGKRPSDLDQPYDVIVIGDSFTFRSGNSWVSFLADLTGWRIIAFHHRDVTLQELIASPQYRQNPPALLIFQTVERWVVKRLSELRTIHSMDSVAWAARAPLPIVPQFHPREARGRNTEFDDVNERLSVAVHQTRIRISEAITGTRHAQVMALGGSRQPLFSSRDQSHILLLANDLRLRKTWAARMPEAHQGFSRAREILRPQGTELAVLVFPDKLTVYADYLEDTHWRDTTLIPEVAAGFAIPRLDQAFAQAVQDGAVDLYPPNNTHSGSAANRLAAETFLRFMVERAESGQGLVRFSNIHDLTAAQPAHF